MMFLYQIAACTIYAKIQNIMKNNKFKISAPTWNGKFELPNGSCFVPNIQDYFKQLF